MPGKPESIDYDALVPRVIAALEVRRRRRNPGEPPRWLPARVIARTYGIRPRGSLDSQKRGVRLLMKRVAEQGGDLIASFHGYALAEGAADLAAHAEWRQRMGLAHLVNASETRRSEAMDDAQGQQRFRDAAQNKPHQLNMFPSE